MIFEENINYKKEQTREIIRYLIFGVLATFVYFITRLTIFGIFGSATLSVVIAQVVSILFAFTTNKFWVFKNKNKNKKKSIIQQFFYFLTGRLLVFVIDVLLTYFAVDKYHDFFVQLFHLGTLNYNSFLFGNSLTENIIGTPMLLENFIFTIIGLITGIVINYLISKFIIFK